MNNLVSVKDQVVVITGGTGVLGKAIAAHLAAEGAKVVSNLVRLSIESIDSPHQHIVRNILQMSPETEPWPRHGNVVGGTFPLYFNQ